MRPEAATAGTQDKWAEIRDIPGNTGLLATLDNSSILISIHRVRLVSTGKY